MASVTRPVMYWALTTQVLRTSIFINMATVPFPAISTHVRKTGKQKRIHSLLQHTLTESLLCVRHCPINGQQDKGDLPSGLTIPSGRQVKGITTNIHVPIGHNYQVSTL